MLDTLTTMKKSTKFCWLPVLPVVLSCFFLWLVSIRNKIVFLLAYTSTKCSWWAIVTSFCPSSVVCHPSTFHKNISFETTYWVFNELNRNDPKLAWLGFICLHWIILENLSDFFFTYWPHLILNYTGIVIILGWITRSRGLNWLTLCP